MAEAAGEIQRKLQERLDGGLFRCLDTLAGPEDVTQWFDANVEPLDVARESDRANRTWDLVGLYLYYRGLPVMALPVFAGLYARMLEAQEEGERQHKGRALVRMSDCYMAMGFPAHARRYLMLSLCEDAFWEPGTSVDFDQPGSRVRLVTRDGLPGQQYEHYLESAKEGVESAEERAKSAKEHAPAAYPQFPEWVLQQLDKDWMTALPEPSEALQYRVNEIYVRHLIDRLGDKTGQTLELLADYVVSCMAGCRTARNVGTPSTEYDVVCAVEGVPPDFRSELGRYFLCECKDWHAQSPGFPEFAKFCRVLDAAKARFGILFSQNGIAGSGGATDASREQLKMYQDRGIVIVVIDLGDLRDVAEGANFTTMLRQKYEQVRLDVCPADGDVGSEA